MDSIKLVAFFLVGSLVASTLHVYYYSPISPDILILPTPSSNYAHLPKNTYLQGLLRVTEDGVTTIASEFNGSEIKFADEVIEAKDESLYFSIPSTKFGLRNWHLDALEARPYGQLLKYNPTTNQVSLLLDNLGFANGVALSQEEDYVVVCETWKFRCLKYWLTVELQGKTEVFLENLPGAPDNINLAPDGSFWVALLQLTAKRFEFVHTSKIAKHLIATFPRLLTIMQSSNKNAAVMKVSADGKILAKYDDPVGKIVNFVTSAVEYEGEPMDLIEEEADIPWEK